MRSSGGKLAMAVHGVVLAETPVRDTFDEEAEAVLRSSQALLSRLGTVRQSICQLQGHLTPTGPDWAAAASRLRESVDLSVHNPPLEAGGDGKQAEPSTPPKVRAISLGRDVGRTLARTLTGGNLPPASLEHGRSI